MNYRNANDARSDLDATGRGVSRRNVLAASAVAAAALGAFPLSLYAGEASKASVAAPAEAAGANVTQLNEVAYPEPISSEDFDRLVQVIDENPLDPAFLTGLETFANELTAFGIGQAEVDPAKPNACLSPVSLYLALALLAQGAGAESDTQRQLLGVLGAQSPEQLAEQSGNLVRVLWSHTTPEGDPYVQSTLQVANSVWMRADVPFEQAFLNTAANDFYAECFSVAEPNEQAGEELGAWVARHTGGTLEPQVAFDPAWIASLVNTVWYKDSWMDPFNENDTFTGTFHAAEGDVACDFMTVELDANIVRGAGYQMASLGFSTGANLSFLLPDEGSDPRMLLSRSAGLSKLFYGEGAEYAKVTYVVPKVSFEATVQVKEICELMGVRDVFGDAADLSAMTPVPACVSSVEQGTRFAMNEMGVEASAYTMIAVMEMSLRPEELERVEFRLDRPFAFRLTSPEGIVLFTGIVGDPTKA